MKKETRKEEGEFSFLERVGTFALIGVGCVVIYYFCVWIGWMIAMEGRVNNLDWVIKEMHHEQMEDHAMVEWMREHPGKVPEGIYHRHGVLTVYGNVVETK